MSHLYSEMDSQSQYDDRLSVEVLRRVVDPYRTVRSSRGGRTANFHRYYGFA